MDAQLNGNNMIDTSEFKKNYLSFFVAYLKKNYLILFILIALFFFTFLAYQYYSFSQEKKIYKNSIIFFNSKNSEASNDFYEVMEKLSLNQDFYSVLANLEKIKVTINNKNYLQAEELYLELLEKNNITNIYKSAIASHAAYSFLNIIFDNLDLNLITSINNFIRYIDDQLISYKGIKLEIKYMLTVAELDINNKSSVNDNNLLKLYKQINESEEVSSSIKERVNQIHEYQINK